MKKLILSAALAFGMAGAAQAQISATNMTLCGASPGGMWSLVGVGVDAAVKTDFPKSSVTYQTSSGGPANVVQVKKGTCTVGLANDGDLAAAAKGKAPFKQPVEGLTALAVTLDWLPVMWIARQDFAEEYGIKSLSDLVEKKPPVRIVMNRRGLLTSDITTAVLDSLGVTLDEVKSWGGSIQYQASAEQANLMQNGRVDLIANTLFEGDRSIAEVASGVKLTMLDVPEKANQAVIDEFYLKPWKIKAGAFPWQKNDANTVTTSVILFADESLSEETAYELTKAILANPAKMAGVSKSMEKFTPEVMTQQKVVPFHPGAIRAYKEAGLM